MRKYMIIAMAVTLLGITAIAQEKETECNSTECGPDDTKTGEAKVITSMRSDLQSVIDKMAKSDKGFSESVTKLKIEAGANDDESLSLIYQRATLVRTELTTKLKDVQFPPHEKETSVLPLANKQQLVASLQKEIKLLLAQMDKF